MKVKRHKQYGRPREGRFFVGVVIRKKIMDSVFQKNVWFFQIFLLPLHHQQLTDKIMRVIAKSTLVAYYTKNPQAKTALEDWYEKTKGAEWSCFSDIKKTFNSVDSVGNKRYVFNIKGNDFRLVVMILFTPQRVYIRFVGTHAEYDKIANIQKI